MCSHKFTYIRELKMQACFFLLQNFKVREDMSIFLNPCRTLKNLAYDGKWYFHPSKEIRF